MTILKNPHAPRKKPHQDKQRLVLLLDTDHKTKKYVIDKGPLFNLLPLYFIQTINKISIRLIHLENVSTVLLPLTGNIRPLLCFDSNKNWEFFTSLSLYNIIPFELANIKLPVWAGLVQKIKIYMTQLQKKFIKLDRFPLRLNNLKWIQTQILDFHGRINVRHVLFPPKNFIITTVHS